jgi:hypothetical protein
MFEDSFPSHGSHRFQWVFCQLETLRHAVQPDVREILEELPETLNKTYELILKNIHQKNRKHAHRLLHCLAVAVRPLRVEELAEVLTFDFDGAQGSIPKFHEDRRLNCAENAVLSTCSSLIAVVDNHGSRVVQFSHLSVQEFLTSDHLGSTTGSLSLYHILPGPAHTILAQVCLGLLLHVDDHNRNESVRASPLAEYAARHWVAHAQFEDVALSVMHGIQSLFDLDKPHFVVWIGLFDIIAESRTSSKAWYYAAMDEFRDLVLHLAIKHPQHANTIRIQALHRLTQYSLVSTILPDSITDIDHYIPTHNSLSLCSPSDSVYNISAQTMAQLDHYIFPQQKEDLDRLIVAFTRAIFLPPLSRVRPYLNLVQLLFRLSLALLHRSEKFEQPEDLGCSITYLRYLRGLSLNSIDVSRCLTTTSLIRALAIQVKWEDRDGTQDIEEMLVLCRELLTSDCFPVAAFTSLNNAVNSEFNRGRVQLLAQVIECLRDGVKMCPPGWHLVSFALAKTLYTRFIHAHSHDDYDEATALLEWVLNDSQPGVCQDEIRNQASSLGTMLAFVRSTIFQKPKYTEVATSRLRTSVSSSSIDDGLRLRFTNILAIQARERFRRYHLPESLEEANLYTSYVVYSSSSQGLEEFCPESLPDSYTVMAITDKIQTLEELLPITPLGSKHHKQCLNQLVRWCKSKFYRTNDMWDIEESVKYSRLLLDATHSSDPMRSNPLSSLRDILLLASQENQGYQLPR